MLGEVVVAHRRRPRLWDWDLVTLDNSEISDIRTQYLSNNEFEEVIKHLLLSLKKLVVVSKHTKPATEPHTNYYDELAPITKLVADITKVVKGNKPTTTTTKQVLGNIWETRTWIGLIISGLVRRRFRDCSCLFFRPWFDRIRLSRWRWGVLPPFFY